MANIPKAPRKPAPGRTDDQAGRESDQREQLLIEEGNLLELIASGCELDECLTALCEAVPRLQAGARAAILLADEQRSRFFRSIAPGLLPSFVQGLKDAPINGLCIGTCGEAVFRGERITSTGIPGDEKWSAEWRALCAESGVLACQSTPIPGPDGPLGSFMLCLDEARALSDWEQRLGEFGARLAGIAIERDRSVGMLRKSRDELQAFFNSTAVGAAVLTLTTAFVRVNAAFCAITGYSEEELLSLDCVRLTHADDRPEMQRLLKEMLAGERRDFTLEKRYLRKDGAVIWVLNNVSLTRDEAGQPLQLIALTQDISQRRSAEEGARRLAAVVESSDDAIISKDLNGIIQTWNAGAERTFGYRAEEVVGQPVTILMPPDRYDEEPGILSRIRRGERIDHYETIRRRKDGKLLDISLTISPLTDSSGRIIGASKIARDITDRKRAEEELRNASRLKDELLGLVSHEFRTPLTTITGNVDVLTRRFEELTPELRDQAFDELRRESERLKRLIQNMLIIARAERGQDRDLEPLLLQRVLPEFVAAEQQRDPSRTIVAELPKDLPPVVANYGYMDQILVNLFTNSRKYGAEGTPIELSAWGEGDHVAVRVADRGRQLSEEETARFVEAFYRSELVRSQSGGAGLGLAVCARLVDLFGGELRPAPREGGGLEVTFTMPVAEGE